jgi:hypothetical protein
MCGKSGRIFFLSALLLCHAWGALQAEERWFLITEQELQSIEDYRKNSEAERLNWLLQVSELRTQAGRLSGRAESLRTDSEHSNQQLRQERELNRRLTQSFNEYEAGQSLLMSQKDTRIVQLETENEGKDKIIFRLIITVILMGAVILIPLIAKIILRK